MARPNTMRFGKYLVLLGDGGSPENFAQPCGLTERSLDLGADTNTTPVPDCDDPDAPAWAEADITTLKATISGQGVLAQEAHAIWRNWFFTGQAKNVRVLMDVPLANGGGYYYGAALLTQLKFDSNFGDKVKVSVTITNTSAWAWQDAAA